MSPLTNKQKIIKFLVIKPRKAYSNLPPTRLHTPNLVLTLALWYLLEQVLFSCVITLL